MVFALFNLSNFNLRTFLRTIIAITSCQTFAIFHKKQPLPAQGEAVLLSDFRIADEKRCENHTALQL